MWHSAGLPPGGPDGLPGGHCPRPAQAEGALAASFHSLPVVYVGQLSMGLRAASK